MGRTEGTLGTWSSQGEYGLGLKREASLSPLLPGTQRVSVMQQTSLGVLGRDQTGTPPPSSFLTRSPEGTGPEPVGEPLPFPSSQDLPGAGQWLQLWGRLTPRSPPVHHRLASRADIGVYIDLGHT